MTGRMVSSDMAVAGNNCDKLMFGTKGKKYDGQTVLPRRKERATCLVPI
jgi:hypothetical protein